VKLPVILLSRFSFLCFILFIVFTSAAWGEFSHTVNKGDSLHAIAKKYGVSISRIREANNLDGTQIRIGQRLVIPERPTKVRGSSAENKAPKSEVSETTDSAQGTPEAHVVKKGDTLIKLANRYHLPIREIKELNEIIGSNLKIGQVLRLKREGEKQEEPEGYLRESEQEAFAAQAVIPRLPAPQSEAPSLDRGPNSLVQVAQGFLGVKYRRGGTSLISGLDCSALVQEVFRVVGVDLPRTAREQFEVGLAVARDALRLGDLVFFQTQKARRPTHVGIYIGNGQFIHTSLSRQRVKVDSLASRYFSSRFLGGRRIGEADKKAQIEGPPNRKDEIHGDEIRTPLLLHTAPIFPP
jgi:cell wall-associated NlpC family hydrolase